MLNCCPGVVGVVGGVAVAVGVDCSCTVEEDMVKQEEEATTRVGTCAWQLGKKKLNFSGKNENDGPVLPAY